MTEKLYELHCGDSLEIIPELIKQGVQVDSIVTDPPYHLQSIVKRFGKTSVEDDNKTGENARNRSNQMSRLSKGFMGKEWDGGDIAFNVELWKMCFDVLKPGGWLLAFSGTRTQHRMVCAIEDAGFEVRDQIAWMYGSGFPKSHNISKAIDKMKGVKRTEVRGIKPGHEEFVGRSTDGHNHFSGATSGFERPWMSDPKAREDYHKDFAPATPEAAEWDGWGTALKPAWEPICVARKPLEDGTSVAKNVLKHRTGGLNIDACRVPLDLTLDAKDFRTINRAKREEENNEQTWGMNKGEGDNPQVLSPKGRWPANIIHDGSDEVLEEFAKYGNKPAGKSVTGNEPSALTKEIYGDFKERSKFESYADNGSAARFFYCSKASAKDRGGSGHPTVKPIALMSYLTKLVTPPNGKVLDPFAGSGTTGEAAVENGFYPILIEREKEYQDDIKKRLEKFEHDTVRNFLEEV